MRTMGIGGWLLAGGVLIGVLSLQAQTHDRAVLAGTIHVHSFETGWVVVGVDEATRNATKGDGTLDRVFSVQREHGQAIQYSGAGTVDYTGTRLIVAMGGRPARLVFRIPDKDPQREFLAVDDVESVIGISSATPAPSMRSPLQLFDAANVLPMRPPSCSSCSSGGEGSTQCSMSCGGTSCSTTCASPYSACCNCVQSGYPTCLCCRDDY